MYEEERFKTYRMNNKGGKEVYFGYQLPGKMRMCVCVCVCV